MICPSSSIVQDLAKSLVLPRSATILFSALAQYRTGTMPGNSLVRARPHGAAGLPLQACLKEVRSCAVESFHVVRTISSSSGMMFS
jgi:hypothetical protein